MAAEWDDETDDPEPAPVVEEPGNALALMFGCAALAVLGLATAILFAGYILRSAGG